MKFVISNQYKNGIQYIDFCGILGMFDKIFNFICYQNDDTYTINVYYRVLIMLCVLYKWKLKKIKKFNIPITKNYLINNIKYIIKSIKIGECLQFTTHKYIINLNEIKRVLTHIQKALLITFRFIIGSPRDIAKQLPDYVITSKRINELLGFIFIYGYDIYNEEKTSTQLSNIDDIITKISNIYPEIKMIIYAREGNDKNALKNINYVLQKKYTRIAHGFPLLSNKLKFNSPTYLEICPISNMLLGFYKINIKPYVIIKS